MKFHIFKSRIFREKVQVPYASRFFSLVWPKRGEKKQLLLNPSVEIVKGAWWVFGRHFK